MLFVRTAMCDWIPGMGAINLNYFVQMHLYTEGRLNLRAQPPVFQYLWMLDLQWEDLRVPSGQGQQCLPVGCIWEVY